MTIGGVPPLINKLNKPWLINQGLTLWVKTMVPKRYPSYWLIHGCLFPIKCHPAEKVKDFDTVIRWMVAKCLRNPAPVGWMGQIPF